MQKQGGGRKKEGGGSERRERGRGSRKRKGAGKEGDMVKKGRDGERLQYIYKRI